MKDKQVLCVFLVALLVLLLFIGFFSNIDSFYDSDQLDVFVGVDVAYDNITSLKKRVDEVKSYTNFFIIGSTGITFNATKLDDVCHYLNDSGLHFAVFEHPTTYYNQSEWISQAKEKWKYFLGLYPYDEPGGNQIDSDGEYRLAKKADNYSDAAEKFVENLNYAFSEYRIHDLPMFTSDYVLHEYNYRAGYDVVLAHYAWNHSRPLNTALCRGAATMHGKDWGVMITYTYTGDIPPFLVSGPEIYDDMITAYENGAKYIVIFDYAKDPATNVTYGILEPEHLYAMRQFWNYAREHPRIESAVGDRMAYVLPKDYGYGFRGPSDSIWGLWNADNKSSRIWNDVNTFVEQNKPLIDIIYEDTVQYGTFNYGKLVFWNGTIISK